MPFRFFKTVDGRHLGFDIRVFWPPPTKSICWSLSMCQMWLDSVQQFWQYTSFNIFRVRLEMPIHAPNMGSIINMTPKRTLLCGNMSYNIWIMKIHSLMWVGHDKQRVPMGWTTPIIAHSPWGLHHHIIHSTSVEPPNSASQMKMASRLVKPFL